ncbi:MAG: hypothetical protein C4339_03485 [Nitrososphaerota archaeon]
MPRPREPVELGKELEDRIAALAEQRGWIVEKRKKFGPHVLDLVLRRRGLVLVVQCKNTAASPRDVTQTRKDFEAYLNWLLEEKLGILVQPVLVAREFSERTKRRASGYRVLCYMPDELEKLLG